MQNKNEKLLERYPALWTAHDIEAVLENFTDDCIYEDLTLGVTNRGKEELRGFANEVYGTMPDFHLSYSDYFATETRGVALWNIKGTWNGELEGIDVTGKKVDFSGVTLFKFIDGKISRNSDYWDYTVQLKQLGVLTKELRDCR